MNAKTRTTQTVCLLFTLFSLCILPISFSKESAPLVWEDATTQQILFTSNDIVAFDWEKQIVLLNLDAYLDFLAWVPPHKQLSRQLVVKDHQGIIYQATWVSPVSSMGYNGPIYETPMTPSTPLISIQNGYPGSVPGEADLRFAERLRMGLAAANRLRAFDPETDFLDSRIRTQRDTWIDCGDDLKIRIECFENTFQINRQARAHIFLSYTDNPQKIIDAIETIIQIEHPLSTGKTDPIHLSISSDEIAQGIRVCEFDPWIPNASGQILPHQGECQLRFSFQLQQKTGDSLTTIRTVKYPELKFSLQSTMESNVQNSDLYGQKTR